MRNNGGCIVYFFSIIALFVMIGVGIDAILGSDLPDWLKWLSIFRV